MAMIKPVNFNELSEPLEGLQRKYDDETTRLAMSALQHATDAADTIKSAMDKMDAGDKLMRDIMNKEKDGKLQKIIPMDKNIKDAALKKEAEADKQNALGFMNAIRTSLEYSGDIARMYDKKAEIDHVNNDFDFTVDFPINELASQHSGKYVIHGVIIRFFNPSSVLTTVSEIKSEDGKDVRQTPNDMNYNYIASITSSIINKVFFGTPYLCTTMLAALDEFNAMDYNKEDPENEEYYITAAKWNARIKKIFHEFYLKDFDMFLTDENIKKIFLALLP